MKTQIRCLQCNFTINTVLPEKNIERYKEKHTFDTGHTKFAVKEKKRLQL